MNASPTYHAGMQIFPYAEALNNGCFCLTLDSDALARALDAELATVRLSELVRERCPHVFAAGPVFVAASQLDRMAEVIRAVEAVVALPAYRELVFSTAPEIARLGTAGPKAHFSATTSTSGRSASALSKSIPMPAEPCSTQYWRGLSELAALI